MEASAPKVARRSRVYSTVGDLIAHPLRSECLTVLADRKASPKELARLLRKPLPQVAYHVRGLAEAGAIELVETRQVRGSVEHTYRAVTRPALDTEACEAMTPDQRTQFTRLIFSVTGANANTALDSGSLAKRPDLHVSRTPLRLDDAGWEELSRAYDDFAEKVWKIQEASTERLGKTPDDAGIPVISFLAMFEMPEPSK